MKVEFDMPGHSFEIQNLDLGSTVVAYDERDLSVRLTGTLQCALYGEVGE